jgi:hypothetical protein
MLKNFKNAGITALVSIAVLVAVFMSAGAALAAGAFNPKPLFEVGIGGQTPEMLGEATDESKIVDYDKFYYPAAMVSSEQEDRVFVLDSIKNRICAFTLAGKLAYEIKLPFAHHAIDMAYFKDAKRFFIVFQQTPLIGVLDIKDAGAKASISASDLLDAQKACGAKEFNVQNIWPCDVFNVNENRILLNAFFSDFKNIALSYKNGVLAGAATKFKTEEYARALISDPSIMTLETDTKETRLVREKLTDQDTDWHTLLKELTLGKPGFNCRNIRIIGSDAAGNAYVEAHYGFGEDNIQQTFVYRFNKNGRFNGRTEIFHSPEMLTNQFVTVDLSGSVFYMKKDEKANKIQFYKFIIDELN